MIKALKKSGEFQKVYKSGKYFISPYTILYILPNNEKDNRLGISISKKVGNSVIRHRIKRLYREVYRNRKKELKKGYDLILVARKKASKLDFNTTTCDLRRLFKKSKILESE